MSSSAKAPANPDDLTASAASASESSSSAASDRDTPAAVKGVDKDVRRRVRTAVAAIQDRKGLELQVLELAQVTDFTDYFLICSGASQRQVQAIAEAVLEALKEQGVKALHVEGLPAGQWVLLDFGDFLVHIFDQDQRGFYGLDRLWSDAPNVVEELAS